MIEDRSVFARRDLLAESLAGITSRPSRTALTALGTVLGVAALVATLGLARTAGNRVISRFDELSGTSLVVTPASDRFDSNSRSPLPWDAQDRLERLNGVAAAGTLSDVEISGALLRAVPVVDPTGATAFSIPVVATSGGIFDAVRAEIATGTVFDEAHNNLAASVAVLGAAAAAQLSVTRVDNQPAIFIGDVPVVIMGILANVKREPTLLSSVIVTDGFARDRFGLTAPAAVHIDTDIGAAQLIGAQAPLVLMPSNPEHVQVRIPPDPATLRERVGEDINALFLLLGGISLLVGAIGIANVTLVSVLERTNEIGLRRSLGATRTHIATLFLTESAILGMIAGIIGTSIGVLTVVAAATVNGWVPVLQPWLPFATPFLGLVIGVVSGAYPAWRAASIEPITALRTGT